MACTFDMYFGILFEKLNFYTLVNLKLNRISCQSIYKNVGFFFTLNLSNYEYKECCQCDYQLIANVINLIKEQICLKNV